MTASPVTGRRASAYDPPAIMAETVVAESVVGGRMLAVLAVILAAGSAGLRAAEVPQDESGFTAYVAQAIAHALPEAKVAVEGPLMLTVSLPPNRGAFSVGLANVRSYCTQNAPGCAAAVATFAANSATTLRDAVAPIDKATIRAVIRTKAYLDDLRRRPELSGSAPVARPLAGDLWVLGVVDRKAGVKILTTDDLAPLGLSEPDAITLATRNVAAALPPMTAAIHDLPPSGVGYIAGNFYASSRMLLHDDWKELSRKLNGKLVVAVPAPEVLVYGEAKDRATLDAIGAMARDTASKAPRPISPSLFKWVAGGWEPIGP
jgi:hypothetical protein